MTVLCIYREGSPEAREVIRDPQEIAKRLDDLGALFERWEIAGELPEMASQEAVLENYREPVERLKHRYGFQSADVISVHREHPQKTELRAKFLKEHVHTDFEIRFFVAGRGLFYLHPDERVFALLCEQGDLLSVPDHLKHWFDLGSEPELKCIRLFTTPEGWVADFTGSSISEDYPKLEAFVENYA